MTRSMLEFIKNLDLNTGVLVPHYRYQDYLAISKLFDKDLVIINPVEFSVQEIYNKFKNCDHWRISSDVYNISNSEMDSKIDYIKQVINYLYYKKLLIDGELRL